MKQIARLTQKSVSMQVTIEVKKIGAEVDEDVQLYIVWKRGKNQEESNEFDLNNVEVDVSTSFIFSKPCWFFMSGNKYEKKTCDFQIFQIQDKKKEQIAQIQNYNMALFCNQKQAYDRIEFKDSKYSNTFIEVEWTIQEGNQQDLNDVSRIASTQGSIYLTQNATQITQLSQENHNLKEESKQNKISYDILLDIKKKIEIDFEDLKKVNEDLKNQNVDLRNQLDQKIQLIERTKNSVQNLSQNLSDSEKDQEIENLRNQIEQLKQQQVQEKPKRNTLTKKKTVVKELNEDFDIYTF